MDRQSPPRPPRGRSSSAASPALAIGLAVVAVGLVAAILLIPGLLPAAGASPGPSCRAACPSGSTSAGPPSAATTPSGLPSFVRPTPTPAPTFTSYSVRPGDSLGTIAHKFNTTARSIAWWNRGTYPTLDPESAGYAPNNIQLGWVLFLIPGVVVDDNSPPTPSPGRPTPTPRPATPPPSQGAPTPGST